MNKESLQYLQFFIIILCWTLLPFLTKNILKKHKPMNYYLISNAISFVIVTFIAMYIYSKNKFNFISNFNRKDILYICGISILSIIAGISFIFLIKDTSLSYLRPHISSIIIILTTLFGGLIFEENIGFIHWIGIVIIIVGIFILNQANNKIKI